MSIVVCVRLQYYYMIAVHRFIDNVMKQVVEQYLQGPRCSMLTVSVETFAKLDDEEQNAIAEDDESAARIRARLERLRFRYTKALEK